MKNFLPALVIVGTVALSQITINSDGSFQLSSGDVSAPWGALLNLWESLFWALTQFRPYLVGLVGVGILIKMISNFMGHNK